MGISVGAVYVFFFLLLSFLNAKRSRAVHVFQMLILACLLWIGGAILMRVELKPSVNFWFHASLLGLMLVPIAAYTFLFCMLEISSGKVLGYSALVLCAAVIWGGVRQCTYEGGRGIYLLVLIQIAVLIYVIFRICRKISENKVLQKRLPPFGLGIAMLFVGLLLRAIWQNAFLFDVVGAVGLICCLTYIMYKQYLYDLASRMKIGAIYMTASILEFMPLAIFAARIKRLEWLPEDASRNYVLVTTFMMVWSMGVFWCAFKIAENMMTRTRQEKLEQIRLFQNETASLFQASELYDKIIEVIARLNMEVDAFVFVRREDADTYQMVRQSSTECEISEEELQGIISLLDSPELAEHVEIALLQYDEQIYGFIYLKAASGAKLNYIEEECYRQIAAYASVCLKNISIYQKVYEISIHDELTGLYNRSYYREFVQKHWDLQKKQSLIYMDVDDFKLFNELYGERCGDEILCWCAKKISGVIGEQGAVFRLGANEFLIFTRYVDKEKLLALMEQIRSEIAAPDEKKPKVIQPITFSIGIASSSESTASSNELFKQVQKALFFAKRNGKNRVEIYEEDRPDTVDKDEKAYEQVVPTIYALTAAIDAKDSYTFEHSCNVSAYAVLLAKEIGLNSNEIQTVKEAGLLHDIGKIGIPENILKKHGNLTKEEYEIMKTHVVNSIEMIHCLPNMDYVIPAVLTHHERYDGKGYPRGLSGEDIPLLGRILAVCDSFDAIVSKRSYKEAFSEEYALKELEQNKGAQFDPKLVEAFAKLIREGKIHVNEH